MNTKEAKDRLITLKMSYKIRIEEEDIEALDMGIKALENQKTGHWIDKGGAWDECLECSICGCELISIQTDILKAYCPSCGAKMERGVK